MTIAAELRETTSSKITIGVLGLSIIVWVALFFAGLASGELFGYLAFATLVASVGVMLATAVSLRAPVQTYRLARIAWLCWSCGVLATALFGGTEAGSTIVVYAMAALSFPVGLVALPLAGPLVAKIAGGLLGVLVTWIACAGLGYLQWFVVLPKALRRVEVSAP